MRSSNHAMFNLGKVNNKYKGFEEGIVCCLKVLREEQCSKSTESEGENRVA